MHSVWPQGEEGKGLVVAGLLGWPKACLVLHWGNHCHWLGCGRGLAYGTRGTGLFLCFSPW